MSIIHTILDNSDYPIQYTSALLAERLHKLTKISSGIVGTFTDVPPPSSERFNLHRGLKVDAQVSAKSQLQPKVNISLGTMLAIDDIIFNCCCNPHFFIGPSERQEEVSLNFVTSQREYSQRFYDYSGYQFQGSPTHGPIPIFSQYPTDIWRFEQAYLLSNLAVEWTLLHELSHWLCGHCSIMQQATIGETIGMFEVARKHAISLKSDERKCIELQADGLAFELMFYEMLSANAPNTFWQQYNDATSNDDSICSGQRILGNSLDQRIRILLLVSSAVILLFERVRTVNKVQNSSNYPSPMTRVTNLFATAFRLISQTLGILKAPKLDTYGMFTLDSERFLECQAEYNQLITGFLLGLSDVAILADSLQINNSLYHGKKINIEKLLDRTQHVVFLQQLKLFMIGDESAILADTGEDNAMAEFMHLLPVQSKLITKLNNFSLIEL